LDLELPNIDLAMFENPNADFPELKDGGKEPFQQMTFTLADQQAQTVKRALSKAGTIQSDINENSNGNKLSHICEIFLND